MAKPSDKDQSNQAFDLPVHVSRIGEEDLQSISAAKLHAALDSKKDLVTWAKTQIQRAELEQGVDFVMLTHLGDHRGHDQHEYHFTLESAKHICMMARCAKGKAVRTYFIQVEKKYRAQSTQVVQPQVSAIDPAVFSLFPPAVQALISITHEQVLIKREQDAHATRIAASEKQIAALERQTEAMGATHDWFTALGWVSLQKLQIPIERIKELGKKASQLCHSRRIEMGRVADPRFGKVNSYPKEILAEAAASLGLIVAPPSLPDLFDN